MTPYYLGVDGGASKTEAILAQEGRILAVARAGPSNWQGPVGFEGAMAAVGEAVQEVLAAQGVQADQIRRAVLGLAGADYPEDIEKMTAALGRMWPTLPFTVVNDTEVALIGGSRTGFGVVVICGTSTNVLGRMPTGQQCHVGGLGYEMGDYGGGADLARAVIHAAFRSAEGRGPKTLLESGALHSLGYENYDALRRAMYFQTIHPYAFLALVPLCFQMAQAGDGLARELLAEMGAAMAQSATAALRALPFGRGAAREVVTAGTLWKGASPLLLERFTADVLREFPDADVHLPCLSPAAGAVLMAVEGSDSGARWRGLLASQEGAAPET